MNAQTTAVAERPEASPVDKLKKNLASRAEEFKVALPAHISVDKFQRTVATAAMSNPTLLTCDRTSFLLACMKLAQDGLLPDGREAALVPFKTRKKESNNWVEIWQVQPMPMAYGLRKKILQSGQIVSLETGLVYRAEVESGHFIYEIGMDPPIRHRPQLTLTEEQMADSEIVAAYSIARIRSEHGDPYWSVEVMRRVEIDKVRQTSQTGAVGQVVKFGTNKGKKIEPKGPWVDWYGEMAKKTVLRRHSKVLPMSGDIFETIDRDREEELRAEGAARLLDAEPDAPVALPSNDELDERIDQDTGEVRDEPEPEPAKDPATGMTEVDEETARELDSAGEAETEEPAAAEEPQESAEEQAEESEPAAAEESPSETKLKEIRGGIEHAKNKSYLKAVEEDWVKARAAYDDAIAAEIDGLIATKRGELQGKEGGQ